MPKKEDSLAALVDLIMFSLSTIDLSRLFSRASSFEEVTVTPVIIEMPTFDITMFLR
jgi:hypothetical protein